MSNDSAMEYAQGLADSLREYVIPEDADGIGEYLESVLDYQYTRDSQGELVSVRLLVSFGGPNAWITFDGDGALVEASWYSDAQRVYVPSVELSGLVLDYFQEAVLVA